MNRAIRSQTDAQARGAHLRLQTLRYERRTSDALRIANATVQYVTKNPAPDSPEAYLRLRFDYERAILLARDGDRECLAEAGEILMELQNLVGFDTPNPLVSGDRRTALVSDISVALSSILGKHKQAAKLTEQLLSRAEAARNPSRVQVALNNGGNRWRRYGYAEACAGHLDSAQRAYERARGMLTRSLDNSASHLPTADEHTKTASQLVRESNLLLVELEEIVITDDPHNSSVSKLEELRLAAEDLVRRSEANPVVPRVDKLHRYGRLGQVLVEIARVRATTDPRRASAEAFHGRTFLEPVHKIHRSDADEAPEVTIRYADACRLSGDPETAEKALSAGLRRLSVRCGPDCGPCERLQARLDEFHK